MRMTTSARRSACGLARQCGLAGALVAAGFLPDATAAEVRVTSDAELREALAAAEAGTTILIAPGRYAGRLARSGLHGTLAAPVVITGEEADNPPVFVGGMAAVAWVTADGGHVHHNTFVDQEKWVLRILQENQDPRMRPCHDGLFEDNLIVAGDRVRVWVNVGPGTAPETFRFRRNARYAEHEGRPQLPTVETDAMYGRGQPLTKPREAESWPSAADGPLWDRGAHAYQGEQTQDAAPPSGGFF